MLNQIFSPGYTTNTTTRQEASCMGDERAGSSSKTRRRLLPLCHSGQHICFFRISAFTVALLDRGCETAFLSSICACQSTWIDNQA
mmetsp:Transcript_2440/g.5795  ORF Transcript_2440/g.5795 Transcript_2440/m.5795 type:complete len:86 (+) Transcript_2440:66-323(+)